MSFKNPTYKERKKKQEQWNKMQRKSRIKYMKSKKGKSKSIPKKKKGSKSKIKTLSEFLDKLWSKAIKVRAGNKCEWCGSKKSLSAHHILRKESSKIRWAVENGMCLCGECHTKLHRSVEFEKKIREYLKKTRGEEWWDNLKNNKNIIKPKTLDDLTTQINKLKKVIKKATPKSHN